jgi:DNA-binding transcriptional regulator of glucitol operon
MPLWLVLVLSVLWCAACVLALWQHFRPGLVIYGVITIGFIILTMMAN